MRSWKTRLAALGIAMLALSSGAIATWSGSSAPAVAAEGQDADVKSLLEERHAVLQTIVAETTEGYRAGHFSLSQLYEARREARSAELDLCETNAERVAVLEKMLQEAKEGELGAEAAFRAAKVAHAAVLRAKADRLQVEIALKRAEAQ